MRVYDSNLDKLFFFVNILELPAESIAATTYLDNAILPGIFQLSIVVIGIHVCL